MTKFSDLKLDPKVLQAVAEAGYENPTPIQSGAIPPALEGRDVLGIAQTGTGKTASFTLPMITLLGRGRARARMPRSLVLCPTRELAAQVAENFDTYAKHTRLTKALLIGGVSFNEQDKLIDRGVDVLIATPGRLLDHFERGKLLLTGVQIMVVDEADRMLDMGFIPDIERIFQLTPFTRQTLFFSATMAPEIERITNTFLHAPERIEVARQATASETITQRLIEITPTRKDQAAKQKRELLRAVIDSEGEALKNAIIFCNRKTDVDIVAKSLKAHGYDAAPIHGDLDQRVRTATLDGFREGSLRFLVASDVAARGLDIPAVSHVINFDLPSHAEDYVHRIGRTGRAGREGKAISLGTPADDKYLAAIEGLVKQTLPRGELPEGFHLSDAAQKPPRPAAERGGQRGAPTRTRSRRGSSRDEPAADRAEAVEATVVAERAIEKPAERPVERPVETRTASTDNIAAANAPREDREDRSRDRRDPPREDRREDRRDDRKDDRRDRYRDRDRGPALLGMGEHTPDFLLTSFSEALAVTEARMASGAAKADEAAKAEAQSAETQTAAEPSEAATRPAEAEATTPRRTRSRRSRSGRGAKDASTTEDTGEPTAVAEDAAPQPVAEATSDVAAEALAAPEAPVAQADVTEAVAVPEDAPSEASPTPAPAEAASSDEVALPVKGAKRPKAAPKPRAPRTRRKPVKAADDAIAEAPAVEGAVAEGKSPETTEPATDTAAGQPTEAAVPADQTGEATSVPAVDAETNPVSDSTERV